LTHAKQKNVTLKISGRPVAAARPRVTRHGTYNPKKKQQDSFCLKVREQLNGHKTFNGPVGVEAVYYFPIPKKTTKKELAKIQAGESWYPKFCDLDNLDKFVLDALTKEKVWQDDRQVVVKSSKKVLGEEPRTEVVVYEVGKRVGI